MTDLDSSTDAPAVPWHLAGNYEPITDELDVDGLEVVGQLPDGLEGTYVRNGFNPRTGWSPHWFFGHGMLHAVELSEGRARYRNRYVRTPFWDDDGSDRSVLMQPDRSPANTSIVRHDGQWLALEEQHQPYALDDDLNTLGRQDFGGAVTGAFTAHPRTCPITGELLAFGYQLVKEPYLTYYRIGPHGEVLQVEPIDLPNPVMMHDWNVTENNVVFMDLPVRFGLDRAIAGDDPFFFDRDAGARLGVMPRTGSNADVVWYEIDPCYVFHPVSSYEDGDRIVLTVCRSEGVMQGGFDDLGAMAQLWRWTIDRSTGKVKEEQLDDRRSDFPRIDDRRIGQAVRFGYTAELTWEGPATIGSELYKYDLATGAAEVHTTTARTRLGEAVFAPAGPDAAEDEGWVLVLAHDEAEGTTELRVIDAQDFSGPPVARVRMPRRIPYGAHGAWLPAQ